MSGWVGGWVGTLAEEGGEEEARASLSLRMKQRRSDSMLRSWTCWESRVGGWVGYGWIEEDEAVGMSCWGGGGDD